MSKELVFEEEARGALLVGIEQLADVAAVTLGPKGRNVGLGFGRVEITSDGESIVKEMELKDKFPNLGVQMGKEVAGTIKEKVGDGTTTGIVLFRAIVKEGLKQIAAGVSPIVVKRELDAACVSILKELDQMAVPVKDAADIATVAASGDEEIGRVIAEVFAKVGKEGVITIEEGQSVETIVDIVDGMQIESGFISSYLATELRNPYVLITDKKITTIHEILSLLQQVVSSGRELLIIAESVEGDALSTLVMNSVQGRFKCAVVKAPGFGDKKRELCEEIARLTGATFIAEEKGLLLKEADAASLGTVEHVLITKEKTTLVGKENEKLTKGVAVIKVGAYTESEMKKKKQLLADSLNATRAALEEGIVPGGGLALLRVKAGGVLSRALEAPFRQIALNAGVDPSTLLSQTPTLGFNAKTGKMEDLLKAGVVDPVKVTKTALQTAVSAAGVVLLSEALLA